jgi:hypothetical protein
MSYGEMCELKKREGEKIKTCGHDASGDMATSIGGEHPTKINHNFCGLNLANENYFSFIGLKKN